MGAMFAFMAICHPDSLRAADGGLDVIMIPRAEASATRINEVLEMEPEITNANEVKEATQLAAMSSSRM